MTNCSGGAIWRKMPQKYRYFWGVVLAAMWLGQANWPASGTDCAIDLVQCRPATCETADNWTSVILSRKKEKKFWTCLGSEVSLLCIPPPLHALFFNRSESGDLYGRLCSAKAPSVVVSSSELLAVKWEEQAVLRHESWSSPIGRPAYLQGEDKQRAQILTHLRGASFPSSLWQCRAVLLSPLAATVYERHWGWSFPVFSV